MTALRTLLTAVAFLAAIAALAVFTVVPHWLAKTSNGIVGDKGTAPTAEALALHQTLTLADLHADSLLWNRNLLERDDIGQVDIPRLLAGNFALQMFTTVTKSPRGQNYHSNSTEAIDNITLLAIAQRWPSETYDSLFERAKYQAEKLNTAALQYGDFSLVKTKRDLKKVLDQRAAGRKVLGGLLGTEGSHALDGELDNINRLFELGFRMMSLQHFFDNKLGGSLHGESGLGLTDFGYAAVDRMTELGVMIDVAHSSEKVVNDLLDHRPQALIVSHSGFKGDCDTPRNISDATMQRIAENGGLIGVGFWDAAVCEQSVAAIVDSIRYGIDLVGADHVALGSDWDGHVNTPIDASQAAYLTQRMLEVDFSEDEIRKVMGGNTAAFFAAHLPD